MSKPIEIVAVSGGFNVYVNTVPIVKLKSGGCSFDRAKANCGKASKKASAELTDEMMLFPTPGNAMHIAHQIGRYVLGYGDIVDAYAMFVPSPEMDDKTFWAKAFE